MSTFDPDSFLNSEYAESTSTKIIPVPVGEYLAQVDKVTAKAITTGAGEERIIMSVLWNVLDDGVKAELGMEKVMVRQDIFLDMTEEGAIDMSKGKNRQLGLLREAVGQNKDGKPWSPQKLAGTSATIVVDHRVDKNDPEVVYSEVKKIAKG